MRSVCVIVLLTRFLATTFGIGYFDCTEELGTAIARKCDLKCYNPGRISKPWFLLQLRKRDDNKLHEGSFNRTFSEYEDGFGDIHSGYWLGLDCLHKIVGNKRGEMFITLRTANHDIMMAYYSNFTVSDAQDDYRLHISGFHGRDGDMMSNSNGVKFSAIDLDNDDLPRLNCAKKHKSGWWYNKCRQMEPKYFLNSWFTKGDINKPLGVQWSSWRTSKPVTYTRILFKTSA